MIVADPRLVLIDLRDPPEGNDPIRFCGLLLFDADAGNMIGYEAGSDPFSMPFMFGDGWDGDRLNAALPKAAVDTCPYSRTDSGGLSLQIDGSVALTVQLPDGVVPPDARISYRQR